MNGAVNYGVTFGASHNGEIRPFSGRVLSRLPRSAGFFHCVPRYEDDMLTGAAHIYVSLLYRRKTVISQTLGSPVWIVSVALFVSQDTLHYAKLFACIHVICVKRLASARRKSCSGQAAKREEARRDSTTAADIVYIPPYILYIYIREL